MMQAILKDVFVSVCVCYWV